MPKNQVYGKGKIRLDFCLSRYVGVKGEKVKLHRLDGRRWTKEKCDAQRAVADLAASLLETQARRAVVPGFAYNIEEDGVAAFEAAFPYDESGKGNRSVCTASAGR